MAAGAQRETHHGRICPARRQERHRRARRLLQPARRRLRTAGRRKPHAGRPHLPQAHRKLDLLLRHVRIHAILLQSLPLDAPAGRRDQPLRLPHGGQVEAAGRRRARAGRQLGGDEARQGAPLHVRERPHCADRQEAGGALQRRRARQARPHRLPRQVHEQGGL